METRIMLGERKDGPRTDEASIGRVSFSKSEKTLYYRGMSLQSTRVKAGKTCYEDIISGDSYQVAAARKDGADVQSLSGIVVGIDENARDEYWSSIRYTPERRTETIAC